MKLSRMAITILCLSLAGCKVTGSIYVEQSISTTVYGDTAVKAGITWEESWNSGNMCPDTMKPTQAALPPTGK